MNGKSKIAVLSFVAGILCFVQLLGIEKALMAVIFGAIALKDVRENQTGGKNLAYAAIALGSLYIVVLAVIAIIKGPSIVQLIKNMR